jgi:hypothetical protein
MFYIFLLYCLVLFGSKPERPDRSRITFSTYLKNSKKMTQVEQHPWFLRIVYNWPEEINCKLEVWWNFVRVTWVPVWVVGVCSQKLIFGVSRKMGFFKAGCIKIMQNFPDFCFFIRDPASGSKGRGAAKKFRIILLPILYSKLIIQKLKK